MKAETAVFILMSLLLFLLGAAGVHYLLSWRNERIAVSDDELVRVSGLNRETTRIKLNDFDQLRFKSYIGEGDAWTVATATAGSRLVKFSSDISDYAYLCKIIQQAVTEKATQKSFEKQRYEMPWGRGLLFVEVDAEEIVIGSRKNKPVRIPIEEIVAIDGRYEEQGTTYTLRTTRTLFELEGADDRVAEHIRAAIDRYRSAKVP